MTYLISYGVGPGRATHGRDSAADALRFAYSLERTGETKVRIADSQTNETYDVGQFERLVQGVSVG